MKALRNREAQCQGETGLEWGRDWEGEMEVLGKQDALSLMGHGGVRRNLHCSMYGGGNHSHVCLMHRRTDVLSVAGRFLPRTQSRLGFLNGNFLIINHKDSDTCLGVGGQF